MRFPTIKNAWIVILRIGMMIWLLIPFLYLYDVTKEHFLSYKGNEKVTDTSSGWDIRKIREQPVETVETGVKLLSEKIAHICELEKQITNMTCYARRACLQGKKDLENCAEALKIGKKYLENSLCEYPVFIAGVSYNDKNALLAFWAKTHERYQSLLKTIPLQEDVVNVSEALVVDVHKTRVEAQRTLDSLKEILVLAQLKSLKCNLENYKNWLYAFSPRADHVESIFEIEAMQLPLEESIPEEEVLTSKND